MNRWWWIQWFVNTKTTKEELFFSRDIDLTTRVCPSVSASVCPSDSIIKICSSVAQQLLISCSSVSQIATFKRFLLVFFESFPYTIKYIEKDRVLKNFKSIIWNSGLSLMHDICKQLHIYITIYLSLTFLLLTGCIYLFDTKSLHTSINSYHKYMSS